MKACKSISSFTCGGMNRRQFLSGCAACAASTGILAGARKARAADDNEKVRIRIVYSLHAPVQAQPDWPNVGFDFRPVMERVKKELSNRFANFEFLSSMANGPEQAKKILEDDKSAAIDGYIVYQLNCWNQVVQTMAGSGKPVLYVDFQYGGSGGFLVYTAAFLRRKAANVGFVASSRMDDVAEAVKCFELVKKGGAASDFAAATARVRAGRTAKARVGLACKADALKTISPAECVKRMKESKILAVRSQDSGEGEPIMGIPLVWVAFSEVNEAWKAADKDEGY